MGAIILSSENENDFMLFFYISEDLHLRSNSRRELLDLLTLRFFSFNRNQTLRIYSVPTTDLVQYHINNSAQQKIKGVYDLPPDEKRLVDQEIKGEDEYNEELKAQAGTIEDLPFEPQRVMSVDLDAGEGRQRGPQPGLTNMRALGDNDLQDFQDERASVMIGSRSNVARRLEDFQKKALIGKGTFGKVFLAELAGDASGKQYAIKAIRKDVLLDFK